MSNRKHTVFRTVARNLLLCLFLRNRAVHKFAISSQLERACCVLSTYWKPGTVLGAFYTVGFKLSWSPAELGPWGREPETASFESKKKKKRGCVSSLCFLHIPCLDSQGDCALSEVTVSQGQAAEKGAESALPHKLLGSGVKAQPKACIAALSIR